VARLLALGAIRIGDDDEWGAVWTTLADVEGNEFCVGDSTRSRYTVGDADCVDSDMAPMLALRDRASRALSRCPTTLKPARANRRPHVTKVA
jgi:hypothetical protein